MWRERIRRGYESVSRTFRAVLAVKIKELGGIFFNKTTREAHMYMYTERCINSHDAREHVIYYP